MENGWTKRIEELEESRNNWKREWSLLNAALNMAEDRIKELEAERDVDRRREYGYSQQTVDALTAERDKLEAENKRLAALNDMFPQEIARLEDRVSIGFVADRIKDKISETIVENQHELNLREQITGTGIIETVAIEE